MRFLVARAKQDAEREAFRFYLGEVSRLPAFGKGLNQPWTEFIAAMRKPKDTRTGDEILNDFLQRTGIEVNK